MAVEGSAGLIGVAGGCAVGDWVAAVGEGGGVRGGIL